MSARSASRARAERGAATVELVFVLPIFLAVCAVLLAGAWIGVVRTILDHGAREGARRAAIASTADGRSYPGETMVAEAVDAATPLISPTSVHVVSGGEARNAPVRVEVSYDARNPAWALFAPLDVLGLPNPVPQTVSVTATAEARRE